MIRSRLSQVAGVLSLTGALCQLPASASDYPMQPVPGKKVQVSDAYWSPRLEINRTVTIPHLFKENAENHRLDNLKRAAHLMDGAFVGRRYDDTDVFKLLEAVGYTLMLHPDAELERIADEQIDIIARGQTADGYLYAARTINPEKPAPGAGPERWSREGGSHELYNMGHMIEAAVAYSQATGKPEFLNVATRCADMLCNTFGPKKRHDTSGHEEIELALVKLYHATGRKKYLALAQFFIDQRGQPHTFGDYEPGAFAMYNDRPYRQDDKPVLEQEEAEGHAVRAMYLYNGLTDVAALTGRKPYVNATDRLWENVVGKKLYITGGVGSIGGTEAFVADYLLPNQAYCETCAAIGNALWNERLFELHTDAKYLDVMERIVYNGLLSGVSLTGNRFFYQNPLQAGAPRGGRQRAAATPPRSTNAAAGGEGDDTGLGSAVEGPRRAWFDVACCPANLARFVAQFPGYIYSTSGDNLYVNFFVGSCADIHLGRRRVTLLQETHYPWNGDIKLTVEPESSGKFTVNLRIPGWAQGAALPSDLYVYQPGQLPPPEPITLKVNGQSEKLALKDGFATLRRSWKPGDIVELHLPMPVQRVIANEKVQADRGRVVIQRGPLVYCVEGLDNGGKVQDRELSDTASLTAEFRPNLLGGVTVVKGAWADGKELLAVPYYSWGNRGNGEMSVWLREAKPAGPGAQP